MISDNEYLKKRKCSEDEIARDLKQLVKKPKLPNPLEKAQTSQATDNLKIPTTFNKIEPSFPSTHLRKQKKRGATNLKKRKRIIESKKNKSLATSKSLKSPKTSKKFKTVATNTKSKITSMKKVKRSAAPKLSTMSEKAKKIVAATVSVAASSSSKTVWQKDEVTNTLKESYLGIDIE